MGLVVRRQFTFIRLLVFLSLPVVLPEDIRGGVVKSPTVSLVITALNQARNTHMSSAGFPEMFTKSRSQMVVRWMIQGRSIHYVQRVRLDAKTNDAQAPW